MHPNPNDYVGREQAYVKHVVLERYLLALALKVGQFAKGTTLNYIDGFSGPWHHGVPLDSDRPTSPHVALTQLRDAREQLRTHGVPLRVRGLFVESDPDAYARLESLCASWKNLETECICGEFEAQIAAAVAFAKGGPKPFAFVFIDPTGWTGFGLRRIKPLLQVRQSEVLVNFMLKDILRFVDDERPEIQRGFEDLFGQQAAQYRARWRSLEGLDREDAIVAAYRDRIRDEGGFTYVTSAVVVNPLADRTHYHLVYGTRSRHGLLAFRKAEHGAMRAQAKLRAATRRTARETKSGQSELFAPDVTETSYLDTLAARYCTRAQMDTLAVLGADGEVPYEKLVDTALVWPMTSETLLKGWIAEWETAGRITLVGLKGRQRVPQVGQNHRVRQLRDI